MTTDILILTAIFGLIIYYIFSANKRPKNFPPGPSRIPIFGNTFQLGLEGFRVALDLREKYGDIIGFQVGSRWHVFLQDVDDIRDAFNRPEMQGKNMYNGFLDEPYGKSNHGLIHSEGSSWLDNRRFTLRTLRDFGFGKKTMESIIMEETRELSKELKKTAGKPMSTSHAFNSSVLNVIWSIVAGERFDYHNPRLEEIMSLLIKFMSTAFDGIKGLYFLFPLLVTVREKVPFLFPKSNSQFRDKLFDFLRSSIEKHRETLVEESPPRDLIDTYLEEQRKTVDPTSTFYSKADDKDLPLIVLLMDLFVAGAETTSTTLCWSFFLLAINPEAQEKLYKEIKSVVGNREVGLSDRASLPYAQATIMEIMRLGTIAPVGAHSASQDVQIKGFTIPKNTLVFSNHWALHQRRDIWGDPENFRPERFLSADGKTVERNPRFIPFLVGKRACPGEPLAKDEIFLFLTNLCQQFRIELPEGVSPYRVKHCFGFIMSPPPHQLVLRERNL